MNKRGFSLIEVMVAVGITMVMGFAVLHLIRTQNAALTHFKIRAEMLNLLTSAAVSGSACKSIKITGATPPLGTCGDTNTPMTIEILFADGTKVDAGSGYLLRGECKTGYYALTVKSDKVTKVDPFNQQKIGEEFFAPALIRFGAQAWVSACP